MRRSRDSSAIACVERFHSDHELLRSGKHAQHIDFPSMLPKVWYKRLASIIRASRQTSSTSVLAARTLPVQGCHPCPKTLQGDLRPPMALCVGATNVRERPLPVGGFKGTPEEIERQWYEQVYHGRGDSMAQLTWRAVLVTYAQSRRASARSPAPRDARRQHRTVISGSLFRSTSDRDLGSKFTPATD